MFGVVKVLQFICHKTFSVIFYICSHSARDAYSPLMKIMATHLHYEVSDWWKSSLCCIFFFYFYFYFVICAGNANVERNSWVFIMYDLRSFLNWLMWIVTKCLKQQSNFLRFQVHYPYKQHNFGCLSGHCHLLNWKKDRFWIVVLFFW